MLTLRQFILVAVGTVLCAYVAFTVSYSVKEGPSTPSSEVSYSRRVRKAMTNANTEILRISGDGDCEEYKKVLLKLLASLDPEVEFPSGTTKPPLSSKHPFIPPPPLTPTTAPQPTTSPTTTTPTTTTTTTTTSAPLGDGEDGEKEEPGEDIFEGDKGEGEGGGDSKTHLRLFIGVLSAPTDKSFERRKTIRDTWVKELEGDNRDKIWKYRFILGKIENPSMKMKVEEEAARFGDIEFFDIKEEYRKISYKTLAIFKYATQHYDCDYVMKMDDDSFVNLPKLFDDLENRPREKLFLGKDIGWYRPDRNPQSQWYLSPEEYPKNDGPRIIVGCGYLTSKDGAEYLAKKFDDPNAKVLSLEDVNTSVMLAEAGITSTNHPGFHNFHVCEYGRTIITHYVPLEKFQKYYENIRNGKDMCDWQKRGFVQLENDFSGFCTGH